MHTRNGVEERKRLEEAKLKALKQAAQQGWADVSAGRYADVADDQLEDFVGQLGHQAAARPSLKQLLLSDGARTEMVVRPRGTARRRKVAALR